jgi:hypothetical protein
MGSVLQVLLRFAFDLLSVGKQAPGILLVLYIDNLFR